MTEFVYLYRSEATAAPSPQQMQTRMQRWQEWMKALEAKGHLVSAGHPLASSGVTVKDKTGTLSDGPYAETKDVVMGFSIVRAKDRDEAVKLSLGCPIFEGTGGSVEVRPMMSM